MSIDRSAQSKSNDPDFLTTWSDSSKLDDLPARIDKIVAGWQGAPDGEDDEMT